MGAERSTLRYGSEVVEVRTSTVSGLGCFTTADIRRGETVEVAPIVQLADGDLGSPLLHDLAHLSSEEGSDACFLMLGYGSLYNHADAPNVDVEFDEARRAVSFFALRDITEGEELFLNYGDNYWEHRGGTSQHVGHLAFNAPS